MNRKQRRYIKSVQLHEVVEKAGLKPLEKVVCNNLGCGHVKKRGEKFYDCTECDGLMCVDCQSDHRSFYIEGSDKYNALTDSERASIKEDMEGF